jgi:hypothetical protein
MKALLASWVALFSITAAHAGGVYYSDRIGGGNSAIRAYDFGAVSARLVGAAGDPRGIVFDAVTGRVFYGDRSGVAQLNSYLAIGGDPRVHLTGVTNIADLRPDRTARRLYWCQDVGGLIVSAPFPTTAIPGVTATTVFSGLTNPYFLDLNVAGGQLYWSQDGTGIFTGPLTGGVSQPAPLISTNGGGNRGICVDVDGGMIYWAQRAAIPGIYRRPIAGGAVQMVYGAASPNNVALNTPHGLILDLPARKFYWADTGTNGAGFNGRGISRGDLDGPAALEVIVAGTASNQPWDLDLDPRTSTYAQWRVRFFRLDAAAAITDALADPDLDGASNLLEYALGSAPLENRSRATTEGLRVIDTGVEYPAIRFRRRTGTSDLTYLVQTATALPAWTSTGLVEMSPTVPAEDGMEVVTMRTTKPMTGETAQFFRVLVQSP